MDREPTDWRTARINMYRALFIMNTISLVGWGIVMAALILKWMI